ncbi:NotI-like restriction endonuclease [Bifidobacterium saguini DSM 23967]|uniref:NotI-like restriction endonuclease n=2 Tax=Bifidobacterium saguini TaxID=762210 RepID=A0A087D5Q9_9BIFI|nr:NotI family restriction endonuclease [Bifidobacterium saguini]KFI90859.1 NotI-like restriction endonuclease [Bifidobacterium saguini DSM 23967]QTB90728.1 restriction endonuclease [Bifidobacterium saguini]
MSGYIKEMFGLPVEGSDEETQRAWASRICPFLGSVCTKRRHDGTAAGVCSVRQSGDPTPVICCPIRLYADNYHLLIEVASDAFDKSEDELCLVAGGPEAIDMARSVTDRTVVAVFGHGWGHELPLPVPSNIRSTVSIDWIMVELDSSGQVSQFCAAEVQTIDTTGSHANAARELMDTGNVIRDTVGLNWANVRKRIFTQIVYKGQVLERERHCSKGLYYIIPAPVFRDNFDSLGGEDMLPSYPKRPGTITFFVYDYDPDITFETGRVRPLRHISSYTTGIHSLQQAFSNYMPAQGDLYFHAIQRGLGIE